MMENENNENILNMDDISKLSKEDLNALMEKMGHDFDEFANQLANRAIPEFVPPFNDYATYSGDLLSYYQEFFKKYKSALSHLPNNTLVFVNLSMHTIIKRHAGIDVECNILQECTSLIQAIQESVDKYFLGRPADAYQIMEKCMLANNKHLLKLLPQIIFERYHLYRVRRGCHHNKTDLFHTPFDKRHLCGSYRFSIVGYPSLYLAGSLETALKEARIEDQNYSMSRFEVDKDLRFADLTLPSKKLEFWERYSLVLFYPLIFACGLKVKYESAPFKPEYIIPQILFQVIRSNSDFAGVSYTSTRYDHPSFQSWNQRNIVMKVLDANMEKGYSERTKDLFVSTQPISPDTHETWQEVEKRSQKLPLGRIE